MFKIFGPSGGCVLHFGCSSMHTSQPTDHPQALPQRHPENLLQRLLQMWRATHLWVVLPDLDQQLVDELAHGGVVGVDARNDLRVEQQGSSSQTRHQAYA